MAINQMKSLRLVTRIWLQLNRPRSAFIQTRYTIQIPTCIRQISCRWCVDVDFLKLLKVPDREIKHGKGGDDGIELIPDGNPSFMNLSSEV